MILIKAGKQDVVLNLVVQARDRTLKEYFYVSFIDLSLQFSFSQFKTNYWVGRMTTNWWN
jgi:hypothetical protein